MESMNLDSQYNFDEDDDKHNEPDSPEGLRDETCIDESPEARKQSLVKNKMKKKNNTQTKFMNPPNSTVKLRGVGTASNLVPVQKNKP